MIESRIVKSTKAGKLDISQILEKISGRCGLLFVVSGPSGVGKDTLLTRLEQICQGIRRCVTYTTRAPRPGEIPGLDYNFISERDFELMIERGEFLEYARVHGHLYGSPLTEVNAIREGGEDAILKIDVQGALMVKQRLPEAILVFVAPPSREELEKRLRQRYTDSEEDIRCRLRNAYTEMGQIPRYDYLVVNDEVEIAVDKLRSVIIAERIRVRDD